MKSLLVASALALAAQGSSYFIGNYSAAGTKNLVPFPLSVCIPNGAITYNYVVYACTNGDTEIFQQVYGQSDSECGGDHTDTTFPKSAVPGKSGYSTCGDDRSYMEIQQYLGSCSNWEQGKTGSATTVIASDGCIFYQTQGPYDIYTRTACNSTGQYTYAYANDPTCSVSAAIVNTTFTPVGCSFYSSSSLGSVYSAMTKCVLSDEVQRCETPISKYSFEVLMMNLIGDINMWDVFSQLFSYSTLTVENITYFNASDQLIEVNVSFCTEWEDRKYASKLKTLASYTLTSDQINDNATICSHCVYSYCVNTTMCGGSSNCVDECVAPTTTTLMEESSSTTPMQTTHMVTSKLNKSATGLFVSLFTLFFTVLFAVF